MESRAHHDQVTVILSIQASRPKIKGHTCRSLQILALCLDPRVHTLEQSYKSKMPLDRACMRMLTCLVLSTSSLRRIEVSPGKKENVQYHYIQNSDKVRHTHGRLISWWHGHPCNDGNNPTPCPPILGSCFVSSSSSVLAHHGRQYQSPRYS